MLDGEHRTHSHQTRVDTQEGTQQLTKQAVHVPSDNTEEAGFTLPP